MISYCGLNCAKCDIYEAGHGNVEMRDEIVAWFLSERKEKINPEQVRCDGCRGRFERHWSSDCRMMLCAKSKNVEHCFECADFPCSLLMEFAEDGITHHRRTVENSKRMREVGLEQWISEQERQGKCVFCP